VLRADGRRVLDERTGGPAPARRRAPVSASLAPLGRRAASGLARWSRRADRAVVAARGSCRRRALRPRCRRERYAARLFHTRRRAVAPGHCADRPGRGGPLPVVDAAARRRVVGLAETRSRDAAGARVGRGRVRAHRALASTALPILSAALSSRRAPRRRLARSDQTAPP